MMKSIDKGKHDFSIIDNRQMEVLKLKKDYVLKILTLLCI